MLSVLGVISVNMISIIFATEIESPFIIDVIHQSFPEEINNQFIEEVHQNSQFLSLSADLERKIQNHVSSVRHYLPTTTAVDNFLKQFHSSQLTEVQNALREALTIGLTEAKKEKPAVSKPIPSPPISPQRLQQILPEKLQREILVELFLRGGLDHLSPNLRRKVHAELEQLRNAYTPPPDSKIEEFIQHFPSNIRQDIRDVVAEAKSSGHLPHSNDNLKLEIKNFLQGNELSNEKM